MVRVLGSFNILSLDFALMLERAGEGILDHDASPLDGLPPFDDRLATTWSYTRDHKLLFYGNGFVQDSAPWLSAGIIRAIELQNAYSISPFMPLQYYSTTVVTGLSLDAAELRMVADSDSTVDDRALIARSFAGNDSFSLGDQDDMARGFAGNDVLLGQKGDDSLIGDAGNDRLIGGRGEDVIWLDAGSDLIDGGSGADWVVAGSARAMRVDLMQTGAQQTGAGLDIITRVENMRGGSGADRLAGDDGCNRLIGAGGNDLIWGRGDNDQLEGMSGDDRLSGELGNDRLIGGDGNDVLRGGAGNNSLYGQAGDDRLIAGSGNDSVSAGDGNDWLDGGAGNDDLYGGAGNDTLIGTGDRHSDLLSGGTGRDVFLFTHVQGINPDCIRDFQRGQDKIDLSQIDADARSLADDAFVFVGTGGLKAGPGGQLAVTQSYNSAGVAITLVGIDTDLDAAPEMTIELTGHIALTATDFIL